MACPSQRAPPIRAGLPGGRCAAVCSVSPGVLENADDRGPISSQRDVPHRGSMVKRTPMFPMSVPLPPHRSVTRMAVPDRKGPLGSGAGALVQRGRRAAQPGPPAANLFHPPTIPQRRLGFTAPSVGGFVDSSPVGKPPSAHNLRRPPSNLRQTSNVNTHRPDSYLYWNRLRFGSAEGAVGQANTRPVGCAPSLPPGRSARVPGSQRWPCPCARAAAPFRARSPLLVDVQPRLHFLPVACTGVALRAGNDDTLRDRETRASL